MRPLPLVLLAAAAVATATPAAAQQVRVLQRSTTSARTDSMVKRIYDSDVSEVKRMVTAWRERERQLVQELRASDDEARRRRFEEELAQHVRDGFAMMSAIQARCVDGGGELPAGYLGLNIETSGRLVNSELREVLTTVTSVEPGSPAERAGVARGDRLVRIGGLTPDRMGEVGELLVPGRTIVVRVERDGTARDYPLVVARRPQGFGESCGEFERALLPMRVPGASRVVTEDGPRRVVVETRTTEPRVENSGEMRFFIFGPGSETRTAIGFYAGAEFRALDADWGEVLGVKQGVIVNAVAAGSPAATSGLKSGDVVTAVGATPVVSPTTLVQLLGSTEASEATLSVVRGRDRKTVTLRLAPR